MRKSHYVFMVICALVIVLYYPTEWEAYESYGERIGYAFGLLVIPSIIYGVYLLVTRKKSTKKD